MSDYIPYNQWVHQNDEKIKAEYSDRRTADLADEVERNYYTVSRKAKRLGVQKSEAFMQRSRTKNGRWRFYTPEQEAYRLRRIAEVYPNGTEEELQALARELGIKRHSLARMALECGVHRSPEKVATARRKNSFKTKYGPDFIADLADYYPTHSNKECACASDIK